MRWLISIFSFYMKHFGGLGGEKARPMEELKEFVKENALKVFVGMVLVVALGSLFTAGIVLCVWNLAAQYDLGLAPKLSATIAGGLIMTGVSSLILLIAIFKSTPPKERVPRRHGRHAKKREISPLEEALLILVNDFVSEREAKREARYHQTERVMAEEEMKTSDLRH